MWAITHTDLLGARSNLYCVQEVLVQKQTQSDTISLTSENGPLYQVLHKVAKVLVVTARCLRRSLRAAICSDHDDQVLSHDLRDRSTIARSAQFAGFIPM